MQKTMMFHGKRVSISFKINGERHYLNPNLIKKQNLSPDNIKKIIDLHKYKNEVFNNLKKNNFRNLKWVRRDLTVIEFELQRQWRFKMNADYHRFWETPGCSCPKIDNEERFGLKQHIFNKSCPFHGKKRRKGMRLIEFIQKFVQPNTAIRIWAKVNGGYVMLVDAIMEHQFTKLQHAFQYAFYNVVGVKDIFCKTQCDAVNIVVE